VTSEFCFASHDDCQWALEAKLRCRSSPLYWTECYHIKLVCLHWLLVPGRVVYKIALVTFNVLHGIAPRYLGPVVRVTDLPGRQSLRSAGTNDQVVPPFKVSTIGTRAFPVASPRVLNSLPADIKRHRRCRPSANDYKLIYSDNNFLTSPFNCMHSLSGSCSDIYLDHFKKHACLARSVG